MKRSQARGSRGRCGHRPTTRRLIQLYAALLHNAHVRGFIAGDIYKGGAKVLCTPGLNCYSCPAAVGACPLGALQNALASADHRAGWYVLGIVMLYGVMLGRTICGWLCPFGLIQELLNAIPTPKLGKGVVTRALTWLKYLLLGVFVAAVPLWYALRHGIPLPAFCKYFCPAGTFEGAVGLLANPVNAPKFSMLGLLFTRKFVLMVTAALACVFCYRAFCRFLCPLGAIYGLFNRFSVVGVRVDEHRCDRCGACVRGCGMDVRRVGDHECIQCGRCVDGCPRGAISLKAGRIPLMRPGVDEKTGAKRTGRVIRSAALLLLCLALVWFNGFDPAVKTADSPDGRFGSDAPIGHEVGQQLGDFALTTYDGTEFRLADQRGRITFINLWATYCTPCVQELPCFDALCREHGEDVAVIAIHSSLVTRDPAEYMADKGYAFPCATDRDDTVMDLVGGTGTLPQTVVLNRRGEIVYNRVGSVTPELLERLFEEADGL